jgi:hypothetical protein
MVFSGVAFLQRSIEMVKEQKLPDIDPNASSSDIIKTAMKSVEFQECVASDDDDGSPNKSGQEASHEV